MRRSTTARGMVVRGDRNWPATGRQRARRWGGRHATTDSSTEVLLLPARSRGSRSTAAIALGADAPECHHPDAHRSRPARTV